MKNKPDGHNGKEDWNAELKLFKAWDSEWEATLKAVTDRISANSNHIVMMMNNKNWWSNWIYAPELLQLHWIIDKLEEWLALLEDEDTDLDAFDRLISVLEKFDEEVFYWVEFGKELMDMLFHARQVPHIDTKIPLNWENWVVKVSAEHFYLFN